MPVFWLGEVANLITQDRWHDTFLFSWVPPLGYTPFTEDPVDVVQHLVIPWITLAILYIGLYARMLRSSLVEAEDAGLRAHRARQGDLRAARAAAATAARLDDHVRRACSGSTSARSSAAGRC